MLSNATQLFLRAGVEVVQKRESRPMPELRKAVRKTLEGLAASDPQVTRNGDYS